LDLHLFDFVCYPFIICENSNSENSTSENTNSEATEEKASNSSAAKRRRGRPTKKETEARRAVEAVVAEAMNAAGITEPPKRRRGRPSKEEMKERALHERALEVAQAEVLAQVQAGGKVSSDVVDTDRLTKIVQDATQPSAEVTPAPALKQRQKVQLARMTMRFRRSLLRSRVVLSGRMVQLRSRLLMQ